MDCTAKDCSWCCSWAAVPPRGMQGWLHNPSWHETKQHPCHTRFWTTGMAPLVVMLIYYPEIYFYYYVKIGLLWNLTSWLDHAVSEQSCFKLNRKMSIRLSWSATTRWFIVFVFHGSHYHGQSILVIIYTYYKLCQIEWFCSHWHCQLIFVSHFS